MSAPAPYYRTTRSGRRNNVKPPPSSFKFSSPSAAEDDLEHSPGGMLPSLSSELTSDIISGVTQRQHVAPDRNFREEHTVGEWVSDRMAVLAIAKHPLVATTMVSIRNCTRAALEDAVESVHKEHPTLNAPKLTVYSARSKSASGHVLQLAGKLSTAVIDRLRDECGSAPDCRVTSCNVTDMRLRFIVTLVNGTHVMCMSLRSMQILSRYVPEGATFMPTKDRSGFKMVCRGDHKHKPSPDMSFMLVAKSGRVRLQGTPDGCVSVSDAFGRAVSAVMVSDAAIDFVGLLSPYDAGAPSEAYPEVASDTPQSA